MALLLIRPNPTPMSCKTHLVEAKAGVVEGVIQFGRQLHEAEHNEDLQARARLAKSSICVNIHVQAV